MWCRTATRLLSAHLDDRLGERRRADLDAHLARCAACREDLEALRAASQSLRSLGRAEPPPGLAARVVRAAMAAPRREPSWLERLLPLTWPVAAATAAAALALAITVPAPAALSPEDPVETVLSGGAFDPDRALAAVVLEEVE
jgi:anti-sigma factor RsiW